MFISSILVTQSKITFFTPSKFEEILHHKACAFQSYCLINEQLNLFNLSQ